MRKGWKKWMVLGLALGVALVMPEMAQAQSPAAVTWQSYPEAMECALEILAAIGLGILQVMVLIWYG